MSEFLSNHIVAIVVGAVIIVMAGIVTFVARAASKYWQDVWPEDLPAPLDVILRKDKGRKDHEE
jgi:hypothetical protein